MSGHNEGGRQFLPSTTAAYTNPGHNYAHTQLPAVHDAMQCRNSAVLFIRPVGEENGEFCVAVALRPGLLDY